MAQLTRLLASLVLIGALPICAAPTLNFLFPAGGQQGTTVSVAATGKLDAWPVMGWADSPAIHVTAAPDKGTLLIQIDKTASIGPHLIRLYDSEGASALRCFIVGDSPEEMEVEPNDEPAAARTPTTLPVTINGQLDKPGDVDCYAVQLAAGASFAASVQGRRLGSPMDPMLHLLDPEGYECAFAHDGLGLDPLLTYRAQKGGRYVVRVSAFAYPPAADVKLTGGKGDIYRLHLTTGSLARFARPSGIGRKDQAKLALFGWNLPQHTTLSQLMVNASPSGRLEDELILPTPGGDGWLRIPVSDAPEWLDRDTIKSATVLPIPVNISGVIEHPGQEHRFKIAAKKGESMRVTVRAIALNSPLTAMLRLENPDGKSVAEISGGPADPALDWPFGADGVFTLVVSDLFGKGGSDYFYRLEIQHPMPGIAAALDNHTYTLMPGKSVTVKINVTRKDGDVGGLIAVATELPAGITATSAEVPAKGGDVSLILTAAPTAKPFGGIVRFMVLGTDSTRPRAFIASYLLRQEKEVTQEFIDRTDAAWLTVLSLPPTTGPTTKPTG